MKMLSFLILGKEGQTWKLIHEKNQKQKISWHCPFNLEKYKILKLILGFIPLPECLPVSWIATLAVHPDKIRVISLADLFFQAKGHLLVFRLIQSGGVNGL